MKNKIYLIILSSLFLCLTIQFIMASTETVLNCFGDNETMICYNMYDNQTFFIGSSPTNITEITPSNISGGGGGGPSIQMNITEGDTYLCSKIKDYKVKYGNSTSQISSLVPAIKLETNKTYTTDLLKYYVINYDKICKEAKKPSVLSIIAGSEGGFPYWIVILIFFMMGGFMVYLYRKKILIILVKRKREEE